MDCGRVLDQLNLYIDGMLDERSRQKVEEHLAECADCRAELSALRLLVGAAQEIESEEPPTGLRARIAAATTQKSEVAAKPGFLISLREMLSPRAVAVAGGLACAAVALTVATGHHPAEHADEVALRTLSPAPVQTRAEITPNKQIRVAAMPTMSATTRELESAVPIRRHRAASTAIRIPQATAAVPRVKPVTKAAPVVDQKPENTTANTADDVAQVDDTTTAKTVAYKPTEQPAPEIKDTSVETQKVAMIKVATPTTTKQEETEQWLKEMKSRAAMRSEDRGSDVVSVISARF